MIFMYPARMTTTFLLVLLLVMLLGGCATSPPDNPDNICDIFEEKGDWYDDAKDSRSRWGVPISVSMAIMHQESRFVSSAKPARKWIFWRYSGAPAIGCLWLLPGPG